MHIKNLPQKDQKALDSAFRSCKNAKEQNRVQVIRLLSQDYSHAQVGRITGYSDSQIRQLVTRYHQLGVDGLKLKPALENRAKLTRVQKDKIKTIVQSHKKPTSAGVKVNPDEDCWSIYSLQKLVRELYRVIYKSQTSYRDLMRHCGMSYQKVEFEDNRRKPGDRDKFKKKFKIKLKKGVMRMSW